MVGNGNKLRRWRLSFHRSTTSFKKPPPQEFLCPISNTLMFDPTVVSSGQTFERLSIQACLNLRYTPTLSDGTKPDFTTLIPNLTLKTAIINWCSKSGSDPPNPVLYSDIESLVREKLGPQIEEMNLKPTFSHSVTDLGSTNIYSSTSSEESVIANGSLILPFTTRPSCFSYSSSPSTSSDFITDDFSSNKVSFSSEEEVLVGRMTSLDVYEQEQAVIQLRKTTKIDEEARVGLCSDRLLAALKILLSSRYAVLQTNATAALVNISLEKANKVKIVRAGIVPVLIDVLKNGLGESREHVAGAIFSLALEDQNKTAIGVLGALQPLLHELRVGSKRSRQDAALALYHLTLVRSNRVKVMKLGAVSVLLGMLMDADVAGRVVLVVCNLAACDEGRAGLLDANGVECLVGVLRSGNEVDSESIKENCVAALHSLSQGSLRFKGLAKDAGVGEVLREVLEKGSERAREKARRVLEALRGREEWGDGEEVDWEAVMQGGVTRARYRVSMSSNGLNSSEF